MSWAGLQWAVGKVGHREVRTLRQGGLEGWKESLVTLSLLETLKSLGRCKKYLSFKLKNVFKRGNKMSFGGWLVN